MRILFFLLFFFSLCVGADDGSFSMDKLRSARGEESSAVIDASSALSQDASAETISLPLLLLRIAGSLTFLGLLIFVVLWWVKKSGLLAKKESAFVGRFELLESFPLGGSGALRLVRFRDSVLLLGLSNEGITLLKSYEKDEAATLISERVAGGSVASFQQQLNSFVSSLKKEVPNAPL